MLWKRRIYLDYAAGFRHAGAGFRLAKAGASGNPSSPHEEGRRSREVLEGARTAIARLVEVQSDDVIFTSGATESNALAILGVVKAGDHALYLPSAHASIVENMKLAGERGVEIEILPIHDSQVDCGKLKGMLRPETKLVVMDAVCGETGVIWNTRDVANLLQTMSGRTTSRHDERPLLHVDASQAPPTEKITRAHFGADMLTLDGSKVGAARGIGVLIAPYTLPLTPLYLGGGQERGLRPGSEAPELAKSFAHALRTAALNREAFRTSAEHARTELIKIITNTIPNIYINEGRHQAPHILNLSLPGRDTDYLVALLDEAGFAVSTRSACETDSEEGSRAVFALTGDKALALATLRISWGPATRSRDLMSFATALAKAVTFVDNSNAR